jgi:hypothetical protein
VHPIPAKIAVSPAGPDALAAAHARLMKDASLQFNFGDYAPKPPPDWVMPQFFRSIQPVLSVVFWCVVGAFVAWLLYFVIRELWLRYRPQRKRGAQVDAPKPQWRPTRAEAEHLLSDADALAASGNYEEAVHLILLRSIQDIDRHRPAAVRPALTSREIALLGALPDTARGAFATITRVVERSLFGGAKVAPEDFRSCRAEYTRFAFPDSWAGRAS